MIGQALAMTLVCYGVSDTPTAQSATTSFSGDVNTATTTVYGRARNGDLLTVEVAGDTVRIRGPRSLQPAMSGAGRDGWRDLTNVSITDREIRGQISYNWVNKPNVRIDRMTGQIEMRSANVISGVSGFTGECERIENVQRF